MGRKLLLTVVIVVPFVWGSLALVYGFSGGRVEQFLDRFYFPMVLVTIVGWILYVRDVNRNERVGDKKQLWIALLVFGTIFAQLGYLVAYVWRSETREPPA